LVVRQYHLEKKKKKKRQTRDGHEKGKRREREGKEKGGIVSKCQSVTWTKMAR